MLVYKSRDAFYGPYPKPYALAPKTGVNSEWNSQVLNLTPCFVSSTMQEAKKTLCPKPLNLLSVGGHRLEGAATRQFPRSGPVRPDDGALHRFWAGWGGGAISQRLLGFL